MNASQTIPSFDLDIFCEEVVLDPHPHYRAIRDLGPVVRLNSADVLGVGRYSDVRAMLLNKDVFVSSKGVSMNAFINKNLTGTVLNSDPPRHTKIRRTLSKPLMPQALAEIEARVQAEADALIDRLLEEKSFDGVKDLASYLPVTIVSSLVGLPEEGRANMLAWAAAAFDAAAPMENPRVQAAMPIAGGAFEYMIQVKREDVVPGSWADQLFAARERGDIDEDMLVPMLIDYMTPSLDTTIAGISQMVKQFGENPEQWQILHDDPSLIRGAIEETLRMEAPIRGFARVAAEDTEIYGVPIEKDTRVYAFYGSANRDERYWHNPDTFDIRRENAKRHIGFGVGIHQCAGQHLARLEMTCILKAMLDRVTYIETANPKYAVNSALRVLSSIETTLH
ncbi:MAG: cytochrome P450 [Pseudomonadota bacterium]